MRWTCIGFDMDGTLIDSDDSLASAMNATRRAFGLGDLPADVLAGNVGWGLNRFLELSLPELPASEHGRALSTYRRSYDEVVLTETRAATGAHGLLSSLRELGVPAFVSTNKGERWTRLILERFQWNGLVERVIGGDTLPWRKPAAEALLHPMRSLGWMPGQAALFVGDSEVDATAAREAGVDFALVLTGKIARFGDPEGVTSSARHVAPDLARLHAILDLSNSP